jgi:hypothetical protein
VSFINPFNGVQGSYLLRMNYRPQQANPNSGTYTSPTAAGIGAPPILEDYIRKSQQKKALIDRANREMQQRNGSLNQLMLAMNHNKSEAGAIQWNLQTETNPFKRKLLEASLWGKLSGGAGMGQNLSSSFDAMGGGFVGNENRVDYVGSFVTTG